MLSASTRLTRVQCTSLLKTTSLQVVFNALGTFKYVKNVENKGFSVITGAKQQKSAVARNTLRRKIYTAIALFYKENSSPIVQGMLYVSKGAYTMNNSDIKGYIYDILAKAQKNTK